MIRSWSPPTPLVMVCPDCRVRIDRGAVFHLCVRPQKKVGTTWQWEPALDGYDGFSRRLVQATIIEWQPGGWVGDSERLREYVVEVAGTQYFARSSALRRSEAG